MEPIGEINIQSITIPQARSWMYQIPAVPNNDPPVTLQLGFPIVELPGCVEAHPDNKIAGNRLPLDRNLVNEKNPKCEMAIDGGIRADNLAPLVSCNPDVVVLSSAIFKDTDGVHAAVKKCRNAIQKAQI